MGTHPLTDKPYTVYTFEHRRRRWPVVFLSVVVAFLALTGAAVGGTYLWLYLKVGETHQGPDADVIAEVLDSTTSESGSTDTTLIDPDAQDILVLGSDKRTGEDEQYGRSDTLMVVHIDPDADFVSVLSLPRDLRVEIPGHGVDKINAAYAIGGPRLTIETVQALTHVDLDHYVNVDFRAFKDITSALDGGFWVDVDRRYYYDGDAYENINIPPGYQKLAGEEALDWVRFRHDQNYDFGRMMRQHRFLRAAKEQISKWDAALRIPAMVDILAENVTTDISATEALRLAFWGVRLGSDRIKQVSIEDYELADIGGGSYVLADEDAIREAVRRLGTPPAPAGSPPAVDGGTGDDGSDGTTSVSEGSDDGGDAATTTTLPPADLTGISVVVLNGTGATGVAGAAGEWLTSLGATVERVGDASRQDYDESRVVYPAGMASAAEAVAAAVGVSTVRESSAVSGVTLVTGADFEVPEAFRPPLSVDDLPDSDDWRELAAEAPFALQAPSYLPLDYEKFRDRTYGGQRLYEIPTADGPKDALKVVYRWGREDQFMGIMETTFTDAPAASPGRQVFHEGTTYTVVLADGRPERVWWIADGVLYWVSNTLMYALDEAELLKVATGMVPVS